MVLKLLFNWLGLYMSTFWTVKLNCETEGSALNTQTVGTTYEKNEKIGLYTFTKRINRKKINNNNFLLYFSLNECGHNS